MIDNDNDADDFDFHNHPSHGEFSPQYTPQIIGPQGKTLGELFKSMQQEPFIMHVPESTAYIFTFEINNTFEFYNAYGTDDEQHRIRVYSEEKVYFIKLIRALLDVCGLKEAKDLVENTDQPHVRSRDMETGEDWHVFTVRINSVETAMHIMAFLLKIMTAANKYEAMRVEVGQIFNIRNVKMQPLKNLDYFTIG